jgi:hypothetical protein
MDKIGKEIILNNSGARYMVGQILQYENFTGADGGDDDKGTKKNDDFNSKEKRGALGRFDGRRDKAIGCH